jgi:hypothetical protein
MTSCVTLSWSTSVGHQLPGGQCLIAFDCIIEVQHGLLNNAACSSSSAGQPVLASGLWLM